VARTDANPGGESVRARECGGRRTDFSDDLLRGIDAQSRHGGEPFDGILVLAKELGEFFIELAHVRFDKSNSSSVIAISRR
jgi:hypothetical protein